MGYLIDYSSVKTFQGLVNRNLRRKVLCGLSLFIFLVFTVLLWPDGRYVIARLLFPGDTVVTAAALEKLSFDLKENVGILESLKGFCIQILEGAEVVSN